MTITKNPKVRICCINSNKEADLAIRYGASTIGLVSEMPSGSGIISEELISQIVLNVTPPIATFMITSEQNVNSIIKQQYRCRTNIIQIWARLTWRSY